MELVTTGISGLDEMLGGGFPKGHTVIVLGTFGTGKTTFALQFIVEGLKKGENCIFISLEEMEEAVIETASSYGWDIKPYLEQKKLHLIKLDPAEAKTTVTRIKSELPNFIRSVGAKRIALDSISLLSMMFTEESERRMQLFNLCQQIKKTGATSVLTAESKPENPATSKDGLAEYVADGVILLQYVRRAEASDVQLTLEVIKMRRLKHSRRIKPYMITDKGLVVQSEAGVF